MLSESHGVLRLALHVQPGAKRNLVVGVHGGALKVAVSAPPVDGKANEAIEEFIARALHLPLRAVQVIAGHSSRRKTLSIAGMTMAEVEARIAVLLGAD